MKTGKTKSIKYYKKPSKDYSMKISFIMATTAFLLASKTIKRTFVFERGDRRNSMTTKTVDIEEMIEQTIK